MTEINGPILVCGAHSRPRAHAVLTLWHVYGRTGKFRICIIGRGISIAPKTRTATTMLAHLVGVGG